MGKLMEIWNKFFGKKEVNAEVNVEISDTTLEIAAPAIEPLETIEREITPDLIFKEVNTTKPVVKKKIAAKKTSAKKTEIKKAPIKKTTPKKKK